MAKVQEKAQAIELRKAGLSYKEIMARIPTITSKGTLSYWCNRVTFTSEQIARIEKNMREGRDRSRFKAILANRKNRQLRDNAIIEAAQKEFNNYREDPFFTFGLALYWSEGAKAQRHFQFANSDPRLIRFMIRWIEIYLKIPKQELSLRLYSHKVYRNENCEEYWEKEIQISRKKFYKTIYKPTPHTIKKNPNYKGCFRIDIGRVAPWLKIIAWEECFEQFMRP